jgi:hypothetical protein
MPEYVHVARILPGAKEEFLSQLKNSFEGGREGLKAFGFKRVRSFFSPEVVGGDGADGLLITIYEADDPDVVKRFYEMEAVVKQEEENHGKLVAPHDHAAVPTNTPFVDVDLR